MFSTYYSLCTLFFCCSMFSIRDHFMNFMPPTTLTRCSIPPCSILALFLPQQYFVHWIHPTKKRFICWCFVLRTTTTCAVDCEASLIIINAPLYNVVSIKCLKNVYHNSQVPNSKINSNVTRNGTLLNCIFYSAKSQHILCQGTLHSKVESLQYYKETQQLPQWTSTQRQWRGRKKFQEETSSRTGVGCGRNICLDGSGWEDRHGGWKERTVGREKRDQQQKEKSFLCEMFDPLKSYSCQLMFPPFIIHSTTVTYSEIHGLPEDCP